MSKQTELKYNTRDSSGTDIIKMIKIKQFPIVKKEIVCPICKKSAVECNEIKKIVSSDFTDWSNVGDYICTDCAELFSLYFYNYIVDPDGIRLLNVRELREELCKEQKTPFIFVITTTQKKHLFYLSKTNYNSRYFAVNLETETIYTTCERMKTLFDFVECLMGLGASKLSISEGEIPFQVLKKTGFKVLEYLQKELKESHEIRIPLYCGQKRDLSEVELICTINSVLTI